MATVTAPLLSFGASGQIAKSQVYSTWKGRPYVRRHVTPSNPQTAEQYLTRNAFTWLQQVYKFAPASITDAWDAYIAGRVMTGRNAFTKANLPTLRPANDLNVFTMSPGALGGMPPTNFTVTPGNNQLTLAADLPTDVPAGWTAPTFVFAAIKDQDPQVDADYTITVATDAATPFSQILALADATLYQCFAFIKWTRPDGRFAYSPSLQDTGLTT